MTLFYLFCLAVIAFAVWAVGWGMPPRARIFFGMLLAALLFVRAAHAGVLDVLTTAAAPHLMELIGLAITAIIGWGVRQASKRWGIEVEAKHREALHWALFTGAQLALERRLTGKAALDLILAYARRSVPDAIINLQPTPEVLTDLAKAKLEQVAAEKVKEASSAAVDKLADALRRAGAA
ncbi:hypothetical protein [Paracoccus sp. pheM1]|uniref:hypothetical protein n=1 Tax=Paracoccus sp. pheM1 TaxID=2831675 RepID=UPI001F0AA4B5|nr:hypothetical protein [Paracoccus sp. pheM1]